MQDRNEIQRLAQNVAPASVAWEAVAQAQVLLMQHLAKYQRPGGVLEGWLKLRLPDIRRRVTGNTEL